MKRDERAALYEPIIRRAFADAGLPTEWGMAIACQESGFDPQAECLTGGDGRRGGSFGLCQMSLKTAHGELDYLGNGDGLKDPELNARLAARYCALLVKRFKTHDLADVAAAYNSGKAYAHAPESTRKTYVPAVLDYAKRYTESKTKGDL